MVRTGHLKAAVLVHRLHASDVVRRHTRPWLADRVARDATVRAVADTGHKVPVVVP